MHHTCVFSTDFCMLLMICSRVILHVIKMTYQCTRIMQVNLVNESVIVNIHCKQEPQNVALPKPYLKVLYHNQLCAFINGLDDNFDGQFQHGNAKHGTQKADHHPSQQVLSNFLFNQLWAYYLTPEKLQLLANQIFQVLVLS